MITGILKHYLHETSEMFLSTSVVCIKMPLPEIKSRTIDVPCQLGLGSPYQTCGHLRRLLRMTQNSVTVTSFVDIICQS